MLFHTNGAGWHYPCTLSPLADRDRHGQPWGLMGNGDLWEVIQILVQARRNHLTANVSVIKVKGHATPLDVQNNVISSEDAWGNDLADKLADKGKQAHHPDLHAYAQFFVIKHTVYYKALQALYQHIGACMALDSELRSDIIGDASSPSHGQHPGKVLPTLRGVSTPHQGNLPQTPNPHPPLFHE